MIFKWWSSGVVWTLYPTTLHTCLHTDPSAGKREECIVIGRVMEYGVVGISKDLVCVGYVARLIEQHCGAVKATT